MSHKENTLPRFSSVGFFIRALFGKVFHPNLKSFVWKRHVGALPSGTNMAALSQQKHLSVGFTIKTKNYFSRVPTH